MRLNTVVRRLLGVTHLFVRDIRLAKKGLVVSVRPSWRKPRCGECGRVSPGYDIVPVRQWRHLALGRMMFWLEYTPRRVSCARCGIRVEKVPWAAHNSRFTLDFEELVAYLAQRMDKTAVSTLLGINWRTVGRIIVTVVNERLDPARLDHLRTIGIDEISFRRGHEYVTVVVDHERTRVVWTGDGKSGDTLRQFFDQLGPERTADLRQASVDLSAAYITAIRERAPQAELTYDRFHVQRLASDAVDEVRRAEVRAAGDTEMAAFVKKSRWALLKNPWNLSRTEGEKLREVQRHNCRLYRAYLLKETLAKALDYVQPRRADKALREWINWASHSRLAPFRRAAATVKSHLPGILSYISSRLTNGIVEGLNNKIRLITRRAFGFHSASPLRAMIDLCCGGITLHPPLPGQPTLST